MAINNTQNRPVTQDERRSRALAALILHSGATQLDELDLSNPLIASSSISELKAQLELATKEKGVPLSNAFRRILSSRPTLRLGRGQEWEKVDDVRWRDLRFRLIAYQLSGLLYTQIDAFQVNFIRDSGAPGSPLQYHMASLVTKSSLGYFVSKRPSDPSPPGTNWHVDKMLDLDPVEFPTTRSHTGSMNRTRETLRNWAKRKAITGEELQIHNRIIRLIFDEH